MEEKELTDEEIVKAYECCFIKDLDCEECPCDDWGCAVRKADIIDLIHRVQSENKELRTEMDKMVAEHLSFVILAKKADEQQKAEIERLTERKEYFEIYATELQKQVDELTTEKSDGFLLFSQRMKLGETCEAYFREHKILNCAQSVIGHLMRLGLLNVPKAKQYLKEQNNEKKK